MFTFTGNKTSASKANFVYAVIIIVETNLPVLIVNVPANLLTQKINKNDDIQFSIVYDGNPDDVFFSLIFIYNYDIVATKSYRFTTFAFKIWDLFSNFTSTYP